MSKSLPFIGVVLSNGQIEAYDEDAAKKADWHHSSLFTDKGLEAFDNDSTLRFVRMEGENDITLEGSPSLDPFESGWNSISKLSQYLINFGMSSNTILKIGQQYMGTEFEGKQIGTIDDFLNKKTSNFKRLIKAEFYNGTKVFGLNNKYCECFINPTLNEFQDIEKTNTYKNVRGMIDQNSNFYIWNGEIIHYSAVEIFNIPNGVHININDNKITYIWSYFSLEETKNIIKNCNSFLQLFNPGTKISNFRCFDENDSLNIDEKVQYISDLLK